MGFQTFYDRRVPDPLLAALEEGGFAHGLVDYGKSGMYGLDLHLRASKDGKTWATLYVGTTAALNFQMLKSGFFRLTTHKTYAEDPALKWSAKWGSTHPDTYFGREWEQVEAYLDRVIAMVSRNGRHVQEGVVQSAVSRFPGNEFVVLDREAVVSYRDNPVKAMLLGRITAPILDAVTRAKAPNWWVGSMPTTRSTECDILAVSADGALVTMEVKPSSAGASSIAWAPVQALQYARQFQGWMDEHGMGAVDSLVQLMRQQQRIGMRDPGAVPVIKLNEPVRPLVVVDSRASNVARQRLAQVRDHLSQTPGCDVEVRFCNLVGRIGDPWLGGPSEF